MAKACCKPAAAAALVGCRHRSYVGCDTVPGNEDTGVAAAAVGSTEAAVDASREIRFHGDGDDNDGNDDDGYDGNNGWDGNDSS